VLFIEYDVAGDGEIEVVALINAIEEADEDSDGEAWLTWRRTHDDEGLGCAPVPAEDLARMEATSDPEALRSIVERVILADRRTKEVIDT
jgi:hypothetical protein